jgi:hypothetical protein
MSARSLKFKKKFRIVIKFGVAGQYRINVTWSLPGVRMEDWTPDVEVSCDYVE